MIGDQVPRVRIALDAPPAVADVEVLRDAKKNGLLHLLALQRLYDSIRPFNARESEATSDRRIVEAQRDLAASMAVRCGAPAWRLRARAGYAIAAEEQQHRAHDEDAPGQPPAHEPPVAADDLPPGSRSDPWRARACVETHPPDPTRSSSFAPRAHPSAA